MTRLAITNGRVVAGVEIVEKPLLLADGMIVGLGDELPGDVERIDAKGAIVSPGLVDIGVFAIDLPAFTAGGITRAALMPDGDRPLDDPALIQRAAAAGKPDAWIHPLAAATRGLEGYDLAEMGLMQRAGAVGVATGRKRIADAGIMLRLLRYAATLNLPVITHAEDEGVVGDAVATEGEMATRLGLPAAPREAEAIAVARDIALAAIAGARLHFRQLTTAAAFDLVRAAKARGLPITCGVTPAHLLLSEVAIGDFRTFSRLSPPLRHEDDRRAALAAVGDGTIDILCSSHDPQGPEAKRLPFADAAAGMAGAETLLALSLGLVRDGLVGLPRLFELLAAAPAALLGLPGGRIAPGEPADLILLDEDAPWRISGDALNGMAGNTPFDGLPVQGRVNVVLKGGRPIS